MPHKRPLPREKGNGIGKHILESILQYGTKRMECLTIFDMLAAMDHTTKYETLEDEQNGYGDSRITGVIKTKLIEKV